MQLEALSALDPNASREVALGLTYARAGQPQRAILTLSRAAERYPNYRYTYVALGRVWLENAQAGGDRAALSKALGALEQAMGSEDGSEARVLFGRARSCWRRNGFGRTDAPGRRHEGTRLFAGVLLPC